MQYIGCLVIGNGCFNWRGIAPNNIIPMDMDFGKERGRPMPGNMAYSMIGVLDLNIAITEVRGISIDKAIVNARAGKVFNSIAGMDICLHAIFGDKQMIACLLYTSDAADD